MNKKIIIIITGIFLIVLTVIFIKPIETTITGLSQTTVTTPVYSDITYENIFYGKDYSMALTDQNRIFTWGSATDGKLGNNTTTSDVLVPTDISSFYILNEGEIITKIRGSSNFSAFLTDQNRIFTWGDDTFHQLGNDEISGDVLVPTDISSFYILNEGENIKDISLGGDHALFLTDQNRIFTWGNNNDGELGYDSTTGDLPYRKPYDISANYILNEGESIVKISTGLNFNVFLTDQNRIFTWGSAIDGKLGNNTTTPNVLVPTDISSFYTLNEGENIVDLEFGYSNGMFITDQNRIFTWGDSSTGTLGNNTTTPDVLVPTDISSFYTLNEGENIIKGGVSAQNSMFLTDDNRIFIWGNGGSYNLGNNSRLNVLIPTDVSSFYTLNEGENIGFITSFWLHYGFLTDQGRIFNWGTNTSGQIGNNTKDEISTFTDISSFYTLNEGENLFLQFIIDYDISTIIIDTPFTKLLQIIPFVLISAVIFVTFTLVKKEGD